MKHRGGPYERAKVESLKKTLIVEALYLADHKPIRPMHHFGALTAAILRALLGC
jgi:hypothetical protein